MKRIEFYLKRGQIALDRTAISLVQQYLRKARNNLVTMRILSDINGKKAKKLFSIPSDYDPHEWIVITGYYAMYTAALALLANIGFRSKNHAATLAILEQYFIKRRSLNKEDLLLIKNAQFQKEEMESLSDARYKREIAQYSVTKQTTKEIAEKIKVDAYNFVNRCSEILEIKN